MVLGIVLELTLCVAIGRVDRFAWLLFNAVCIAVVLNTAVVPNLSARSSVLMVLASCGLCAFATWLTLELYSTAAAIAPRPVVPNRDFFSLLFFSLDFDVHPLAAAVAGFAGGALFALIAHFLFFRSFAPLTSLAIGALTVPSGLVLSGEHDLPLHTIAWCLLFIGGFGAAAAVHGRVVTWRSGVVSES